ncbi:hybrid sensor histidine kinase/response regulator [Desulfogranum mediterraneum]|uniref:hybrid sensor histidine kinase/response regulator n=1 Tax=Desulfogranum mediterraneum TaxID=160661 RepID=UPI00040EF802|nr:ABC transporter substrate binding protein [Desulfogranum mediterraneum]
MNLLLYLCRLTLLLAAISLLTCSAAAAREKKHILYLNSYHHGYLWSDELLRGVRSVLTKSSYKVDLQIEYMDAKKYNYPSITRQLLELYREKFQDERFDAVMVSDNDALNFALDNRASLFPGVPVVFCGINDIDSVDLASGNITGIVESFDLLATIEVARQLHPGKNRMIVVGDQSTAGRAIERQIVTIADRYLKDFQVDFWFQLTLEETLKRVEDLPADTFLFFAPWYQTIEDKFYTAEEVMESIYARSSVPIYTTWEFLLGHGTVGGRMLSGYAHGQEAAAMTLRLLKGEQIEQIPIVVQPTGSYIFDYKVMQRLKIKQTLLPPSSIIINTPRAFYELSRELFWTIMIGLLLLFIALVFLTVAMIGRRKVERQALEQLSFQETLMDTIPQLVSWKDLSGSYLGANQAFIEFFGITNLESMVGRNTRDVVRDTNYVHWSVSADSAVVNRREAFRKVRRKIIRQDGSTGWLEVNKVPLKDQNNGIVGILSTAENITKEQNLEKQLLQSQKMEAIGTMAGGIAHDFNNILTSIINSTELAIDDIEPDSQTGKDLQRVLKAARRGAGVVKQILSFSRPSQEKFRPSDLTAIIREVLSLMEVSLPSSIKVVTRIARAEMFVHADPTQIHQVILNLCTNAFHALRDGGGTLRITLDQTILEQESALGVNLPPGKYLTITVGDDGPGIRHEIQDKIFDPFFTSKDIGEGTGLGLAVVHGIVKAHRGAIQVESEPGQGTEFTVYLPAAGEPEGHGQQQKIELASGSLSVLFVEDNEDQLNSVPRILREMGHRVQAVDNPLSALEILRDGELPFDLLISDYDLPDMSGIELAAELAPLPVLLVSGREDAVLAARSCDNIIQVLLKPYDRHELQQVLTIICSGAS